VSLKVKIMYGILAISYFCLIGPGLLLGNSIYPLVFGWPFFYFWTVLWTVTPAALLLYMSVKVWNQD